MVTLKRLLGEAGAGISDEMGGFDTLRDVLTGLANGLAQSGEALNGRVATIATGVLNETLIDRAKRIKDFRIRVAVGGSAGQTDVQLRRTRAGVTTVLATLTAVNTQTDPAEYELTTAQLAALADLAENDLVDLNVSAAPTGGTGLVGAVRFEPLAADLVTVE